jgi:hypothetical protein
MTNDARTHDSDKFTCGTRELRQVQNAKRDPRVIGPAPPNPRDAGGGFDPYNSSGGFDRRNNWVRVGKR